MRKPGIISLPELVRELNHRGVKITPQTLARRSDSLRIPYARIGRNRAYLLRDISKIERIVANRPDGRKNGRRSPISATFR